MTDFTDIRDFIKGDLVKYIPVHARGNERHPDCQFGLVKSVNNIGVFVVFSGCTPNSCNSCDLRLIARLS